MSELKYKTFLVSDISNIFLSEHLNIYKLPFIRSTFGKNIKYWKKL